MNYLKLREIKSKYFGCREIAKALSITLESAKVAAARLAKKKLLVRVKRNIYILRDNWERFDRQDKFMLANLLQTPSYVSLMTALDYYEITTQMQREFIESLAVYRSKGIEIDGTFFNYTKIDKKLYFGFLKEKGVFIASPEKAFLDALYLKSLKRYEFDMASIDFNKINITKFRKMLKYFPKNTQRLVKEHGYL